MKADKQAPPPLDRHGSIRNWHGATMRSMPHSYTIRRAPTIRESTCAQGASACKGISSNRVSDNICITIFRLCVTAVSKLIISVDCADLPLTTATRQTLVNTHSARVVSFGAVGTRGFVVRLRRCFYAETFFVHMASIFASLIS